MKIKGQDHSLTFDEGHSDSTFSNFLSLGTAKPIEAKFYLEPPWDRGMKVEYKQAMSNDQDGCHAHIW